VLEPVAYIAHLAALTEKIRFGISVIILNHRNPIQLAKELATVDHLSKGRLTVGFGLGSGTGLYPAFGIGQEKRVTRFEEAMKVMTALGTQESVTLDGRFWKLNNQGMQPRPLQKPRMPVFLGGHSEPAMRRAIRLADGWMAAGSTGNEESLVDLDRMRGYLAEAGIDAKRFWLSKRIYIAVADDRAKARQKLNGALSYQYAGRDQSRVGLAATPSEAVEWLGALLRRASTTSWSTHATNTRAKWRYWPRRSCRSSRKDWAILMSCRSGQTSRFRAIACPSGLAVICLASRKKGKRGA